MISPLLRLGATDSVAFWGPALHAWALLKDTLQPGLPSGVFSLTQTQRHIREGLVGGTSPKLLGQPNLEKRRPLNYSKQHSDGETTPQMVESEVASQERGKFQLKIQKVTSVE